jgi:hypothetical protein
VQKKRKEALTGHKAAKKSEDTIKAELAAQSQLHKEQATLQV